MPLTRETVDAPRYRVFRSDEGAHLLVIEKTQLLDLSDELAASLEQGSGLSEESLSVYLDNGRRANVHAVAEVPPQSISLNVSSSCNLSCSYCYAARGNFGGLQSEPMPWETAQAAIDRLMAVCDRSAPVTIGFLGGEPFARSQMLHRAVRYAWARGRALNLDVRFSVTTNGTLLTLRDIEMLRALPWAVTVSVDGGRQIYEKQRTGGDFEELKSRIAPLLERPGLAKISARSTITRSDLSLMDRYDAIRELGFGDIGFSPVRVAPGDDALAAEDWGRCLDAYRELGEREVGRLRAGKPTAFSNLVIALKQIDRGACSPYPCGAGGGYFSVSADGAWYACHRAVGDEAYALGDSHDLDRRKRTEFLTERHVDRQVDCRRCWARYLCSGSCHQEAKVRSAASCDFIRGWLDFCLKAYVSLTRHHTLETVLGAHDG